MGAIACCEPKDEGFRGEADLKRKIQNMKSGSMMQSSTDDEPEVDLEAPDIEGNHFQKFELSLPFARTSIDTFAKNVREAADGSVTVTLEALRRVFKTPAWSELQQDESRITKLITSSVFQNKDGAIVADYLILFGFLNCAGDVIHKSFVLYTIFQAGGFDKQALLSASDKDILPAIRKLIGLCTHELAALMKEVDD